MIKKVNLFTVLLFVSFFILFAVNNDFFVDSGQEIGNSISNDIAFGDVDADGDIDVFVANFGPNKVWFNNGTGIFSDSGQSIGNSLSLDVELCDVDSDGDLDAFIANYENHDSKVWLNDGNGVFLDSGQNLVNSDSIGVALNDLDGDGDLDAFVINRGIVSQPNVGPPNKVWLNDGNGIFVDSGQSLGSSCSLAIALGDVDSDGDFDAFIGNWGRNKIYFNNGAGVFHDSGQNLGNYYSLGVELEDVDSDGDLDAFIVSRDRQPGVLWLNNGAGVFHDSGQRFGNFESRDVELGDVDNDGDFDAYEANYGGNRVWLNDGNGVFIDSGQSLGNSHSHDVALGDVDADGDIDAFVANRSEEPNKVWLNISNLPPVAVCKDIEISADENCQASIVPEDIDDGSYDPDEDEIELSVDNLGPFPLGEHYVNLTVTDEHEASDTCQAFVTVVDSTPPVPDLAELPTLIGQCSVEITAFPTAMDNCAGIITGTTTDPLSYEEQGVFTVIWAYDDGNGNIATQEQTVIVEDNTSPIIEEINADPDVLWPPNHKMVQVTIGVTVSDNCDSEPICKIIAVESNEPVDGLGDGDTAPDWEITGDLTLNLRAERSGTGSGRVYTVTVECKDAYDNITTGAVEVTVPHSKKKK